VSDFVEALHALRTNPDYRVTALRSDDADEAAPARAAT
jgi:hypothetical protein